VENFEYEESHGFERMEKQYEPGLCDLCLYEFLPQT
jgi:hypothetical protein